jgi:ABC-type lipoprotein export system ATPase subunit
MEYDERPIAKSSTSSAEQQARRPRPRFGDACRVRQPGQDLQGRRPEVVASRASTCWSNREFIALTGASGSGNTLLNTLGGLDVPSAGRAVVAGHQLAEMGSREQTLYLRHVIGFVWQQTSRNLPPYHRARNVAKPIILDGVPASAREAMARHCSTRSLADRADHRPATMSGGEQQRTAIAVALANRPESCWPTSRPASSTPPLPTRPSTCSATSIASWA